MPKSYTFPRVLPLCSYQGFRLNQLGSSANFFALWSQKRPMIFCFRSIFYLRTAAVFSWKKPLYKIFHKSVYCIQNKNVYPIKSSQSTKNTIFKVRYHSFFAVITEWNNLDVNIWNSSSINVFKKELLKFIRPEPNSS